MTERDLYTSIVTGRTTRNIASALATPREPIAVKRRWGIVSAINAVDSTIDVNVDGVVVPHVRRSAFYTPTVGETVWLDYVNTDFVAVSPIAPSPANQYVPNSDLVAGAAPGNFISYAKSTVNHSFTSTTFTENTGLQSTGVVPSGYAVKILMSLFMGYGSGSDVYDANLAEFDVRANGTSVRAHEIQWRAQAIGGAGQETFTAWTTATPAAGSTTFSIWTRRELGARTFSILPGSEVIVELLLLSDNTKRLVLRNP